MIMWPVYIDGAPYYQCPKPDCGRAVSSASQYCCMPCALAASGEHEIDEHSDNCDKRWAVRKPYVEKATI
ncbi:hypothetical protein [Microbispora sp. NPDC049633]|uniref:hypothetical protein n=1 Tax=Microbispora sp. NPDC049633 TaxID=3154355 RepID=UPI003444E56C